jgi:hypothetical protein
MLLVYWLSDWFDYYGKSFLLSLASMLQDFFVWVMDQLLSLSVMAIDGTGTLFDGLNIAGYINDLPPEVGWVLQQTGIGQAMGIIIAAITIRIILQLIPFTRLGS